MMTMQAPPVAGLLPEVAGHLHDETSLQYQENCFTTEDPAVCQPYLLEDLGWSNSGGIGFII